MLKRIGFLCLAVLLMGADYLGEETARFMENAEGVSFELALSDERVNDAKFHAVADETFKIISETKKKFSETEPTSVVSRINAAATGESFVLDEDVWTAVKEAQRISRLSDGAVDFGSGRLEALWKAAKEKAARPTDEEIGLALAESGQNHFELNAEKKTLTVVKAGARLSLGELSTAVAVDKACAYLKDQNLRSAVLSADEDVRLVGLGAEGRFRQVAIEHPRDIEENAAVLKLDKECVVSTASDTENFFMVQGKRVSCSPDPKTGKEPKSGVLSVTVITKKALLARLLSKAFFVMGEEKGYTLLDSLKNEGVDAVFITQIVGGPILLSSSDDIRPAMKDINL